MSLRGTVFWGVFVAIATIVLLEAGTDAIVERVVRQASAREHEIADRASRTFALRVGADRVPAAATLRAFDEDGRELLARVLVGEGPARQESWPPEARSGRWFVTRHALAGGAVLEVAVARQWWERLLANSLVLDLLDLPLFLAVAVAVAHVVSRRVHRPIVALNAAVEAMAARRQPVPLPVPSDGSELAELARSFNAMSDAVQRYVERERTFTRYASHELRTPLAALKIQIDRVRAGTADVGAILGALDRNVQRMEVIMRALQSLAQAGDRDGEPSALRTTVSELLGSLPSAASDRVSVAVAPPDVMISDAELVRQALANLLENALTYGTGAVTISFHAQRTSLTARVRDVGPGVPDADVARLTEPFFRAKQTPGRGLGLGLSLVDVIARALDGELELRNTGTGFETTLRLPIVVPR